MKKTTNLTMYVFFLSAMLFNIAEATIGGTVSISPFYDPVICYNNNKSRASYSARPAIKKDKNNELKTTIQQDLQSAKNNGDTAPKQNQEDKVIEFIVSDVGH